jgi:cyanate lyase
MTREEVTQKILEAKSHNNVTFERIAEAVGLHRICVTAALLGEASLNAEESERAAHVLGLGADVATALQQSPRKGASAPPIPVDPLIYRFHEVTQVYGTTIKAIIQEMFGEGIMSAIDFTMEIERVPNPNGDRVKVTYEGKFLPYKKW